MRLEKNSLKNGGNGHEKWHKRQKYSNKHAKSFKKASQTCYRRADNVVYREKKAQKRKKAIDLLIHSRKEKNIARNIVFASIEHEKKGTYFA